MPVQANQTAERELGWTMKKGGRKHTACSVKKNAKKVLVCRVSFLETDQLARYLVQKRQVAKRNRD